MVSLDGVGGLGAPVSPWVARGRRLRVAGLALAAVLAVFWMGLRVGSSSVGVRSVPADSATHGHGSQPMDDTDVRLPPPDPTRFLGQEDRDEVIEKRRLEILANKEDGWRIAQARKGGGGTGLGPSLGLSRGCSRPAASGTWGTSGPGT